MTQRPTPAEAHRALRATLRELREASALLRLQAANQVLANRRLLREIRRRLRP